MPRSILLIVIKLQLDSKNCQVSHKLTVSIISAHTVSNMLSIELHYQLVCVFFLIMLSTPVIVHALFGVLTSFTTKGANYWWERPGSSSAI